MVWRQLLIDAIAKDDYKRRRAKSDISGIRSVCHQSACQNCRPPGCECQQWRHGKLDRELSNKVSRSVTLAGLKIIKRPATLR